MDKNNIVRELIKYKRTPLFNEDFPLVLLWSQKAGCTTLSRWFFYQIGLLDKALQYHSSIHVYKNAVYYQQKDYVDNLTKSISNPKKDTIRLVRNPYKRAVSSYLTIASYCYSKKLLKTKLNEDWSRIYNLYYNNTPPYKGISFKQFLYYLEKVGVNLDTVDGHIAKQHCSGEESFVTNYIKIENFTSEIRNIEKRYNLSKSPNTLLKSPNTFSPKMTLNGNHSELILTSKQLINGPLPNYESFYDREAIQLCNEIFKDDFSFYNYEKN